MASVRTLEGFAVVVFTVALSANVRAQSAAPAPIPAPIATPPASAAPPVPAPMSAPAPAPMVPPPPSGYASDYGYPPAYGASGYGYAPPEPDPMSGFHTHDGFYLRAQAGIGFAGITSTQAGTKTSISGAGGYLGVAVGGAIARNLILYGAIFGTDSGDPDTQVGGNSVTSNISDLSIEAFGPGIAYYFEPVNLYIAGTLGLARFQTSDSNGFAIDTSKTGLMFELQVGKEWWASRDWGLGVAAAFNAGGMKDQNTPGLSWSTGGVSLLFSASYN
jgi:hypothetical protein